MKRDISFPVLSGLFQCIRETRLTQDALPIRKLLKRAGSLMALILLLAFRVEAQCPFSNIVLSSQKLVDDFPQNYPGCQHLPYSITVIGPDITNLDGLSPLKSIGNTLLINVNPLLENIEGLSNLESVGATLQIYNNPVLQNISGLSKVKSIGRDLTIQSNATLQNVDGLAALKNIDGKLQLAGNGQLMQINGFSALEVIGDSVLINSNAQLVNINGLSSLKTVGGYLAVLNNGKLQNLNGLSSLTAIGGYLAVSNNSQLNSISGLAGIDPASITGFNVTQGLFLRNNGALSICNLPNICSYLKKEENPRLISGNLGACADETAVKTACDVPPAPCPTGNVTFNTQKQIDDFGTDYGHCVSVPGLVIIQGDNISDLNGLSGVENMGYLQIGGVGSEYNAMLTNLNGLFALKTVQNGILISGNKALEDLEGLPELSTIGGSLFITENSRLKNIDGLAKVKTVGATLSIEKNPLLKNLDGLSSLGHIGENLQILENALLENVNALSSVQSVSGLDISGNEVLQNVNGLSSLKAVNSFFNISHNAFLQNISGFSSLESITGYMQFWMNPLIQDMSGFSGLKSVGSHVKINDSQGLKNLNGLGTLETIGGSLSVSYNPELENLNGLSALKSVGGDLKLEANSKLENISGLSGVQQIGGLLGVAGLHVLTSLQGLENIDPATITNLMILQNSALSICNLSNICTYLSTEKPRTISNNVGACADTGAMNAACSLSVPECPTGDVSFSTQAQINDFGITYKHCTTIPGNVDITFTDIENLEGLKNLVTIGGSLEILHNEKLSNLNGLEALERIGAFISSDDVSLKISGNKKLEHIDGLSGLTTINGADLLIDANPELKHLNGLKNLSGKVGNIIIWFHGKLEQINGLSGISEADGINMGVNGVLSNINGLSGLKEVSTFIRIGLNPNLQTLNGLAGIKEFNTGTAAQESGHIYIDGNDLLNSIQGLSGIPAEKIKNLSITGNGALSICNLPNICTYLAFPAADKPRDISGNVEDCATEATVQAACGVLQETLALGQGSNPTTCGGTNGSITFTTSLEAGSYTLSFKRGDKDTTAVVTVADGAFSLASLGKGVYSSFSISYDENTVKATGERTLSDPATHTFSLSTKTDPTGCNGTNGSIAFSTTLSPGSYTLNFKKGAKDTTTNVTVSAGGFTIAGLSAASYSAFSISTGGCSYTLAGPVVLAAAAGTLSLNQTKDPTICHATNGSVAFTTSLPPGSYTLNFKKGTKDTTASITVIAGGDFTIAGLPAASYSAFSITNGGCSYTLAGPVALLDPVTAGGAILADGPLELCEGEMVKLTAPQGATYEWSTGATTQSIQAMEGGIYTVKVSSSEGCVSTSQITVTRKVCNVPPMAVCKPVVVLVAKDDCYAILRTEDLDAGSYDNNNDWFNRSIDINPALRVGSYRATLTVVDIYGASTSCVSQVHVVDHNAPVVRARGLTLELNGQGKASITVADVDAGSYDNCGTLQLSLNRTEFDCRDLGHHQVILTGTDGSGNVSTALADIHVVDNTPPVVISQSLEIVLDENGRAILKAEELAQSIQDNCGIWSIQASQTEFSCDDIGEHTIILRVEDVQGGVTEAEVTVKVIDKTAPVITAGDKTIYLNEAGQATLTAEALGAVSTDNCGIADVTLSRTEFACGDLGSHEVTLRATDRSGNEREQTIRITVADTTAPVLLVKDVTLQLDAGGRAELTAEAIDQGSTDNCGIVSRELQYTGFDCTDIGERTVEYRVTDQAGNVSSKMIRVIIKDDTAPLARVLDGFVELDGTGKAALEAAMINDGSTDNCGIEAMSLSQENFTCADLGKRLVTLKVRDGSGNEGRARAEVLILDPEGVCPCSYGVLAETKIVLRNNEVQAGGIGTSSSKGMIRLRNTVVSQEGTFVKSEQTRFDGESQSSVYLRGRAPRAEAFRSNNRKDKKPEKIKKGETRTFTAGSYGKIKGKKEAKVIFSGGDVQLRSLKLKKGTQVGFTAATVLLIRDHTRLGRETDFNREKESVRVYSGGRVIIKSGSEVKGYVHSRASLRTTGGADKHLEGFFAASTIRGSRNTHWSGGGLLCRENENKALIATEKGARRAEAEEVKTDSVAEAPGLRVRIWPNTFTTRLEVEIGGETPGGEVQLVDLLGNVLKRERYEGKEKLLSMQTEKLKTGLYILRVSSGSEVVTRRVVKEKF